MKNKWGFLRVSSEMAVVNASADVFTGLDEYLRVIFPDVNDWIYNERIGMLNGENRDWRPNYRSESLKMIVEYDGIQHYNNPKIILEDRMKTNEYEKAGYKVVRIPYFIQLTNDVVMILFGVKVQEQLFLSGVASMSVKWSNTPAFLCPLGIRRMVDEFRLFPTQYAANIAALKEENSVLNGVDLIEKKYTPDKITSLAPNEIFVFGSNLAGNHLGGAAAIALKKFGAVMGKAIGLQGQSYAIPTMHVGIVGIQTYVDDFISFARAHKDLIFYVTRIGCGIALYKDEQIAPLFADAICDHNIILPKSFIDVIIKSTKCNMQNLGHLEEFQDNTIYQTSAGWFLNIHDPITGIVDDEFRGKVVANKPIDDSLLYGLNDGFYGAVYVLTNGSKKGLFVMHRCYGMNVGVCYKSYNREPYKYDDICVVTDWHKWWNVGFACCLYDGKWELLKLIQVDVAQGDLVRVEILGEGYDSLQVVMDIINQQPLNPLISRYK